MSRTVRQHASRGERTNPFWYPLWAASAIAGFLVMYAFTTITLAVDEIDARDITLLLGPDRPVPPPPPIDGSSGRALNILLMGSDVRDGENAAIGGSFGGMRNDTTLVMHISADRRRVELVSIPRDAQVRISDCDLEDGTHVPGWTGDFNIAFANGGRQGDAAEAAACTIRTVEAMSGLYIDYFVVVDFTGFIGMIDALGGVPMCIPGRIVSSKAKLDLQPGPQILDGRSALAFARLRTAEIGNVSGSDLQRIERQQELLGNVAELALSKNFLTDIDELTAFLRAGASSLTTSEELGDTQTLIGLAFSMRYLRPDDIVFTTVPWKYTADFLNVEILPSAADMWLSLYNDTPIVGEVTAGGRTDTAAEEPSDSYNLPDRPDPEELLDYCDA